MHLVLGRQGSPTAFAKQIAAAQIPLLLLAGWLDATAGAAILAFVHSGKAAGGPDILLAHTCMQGAANPAQLSAGIAWCMRLCVFGRDQGAVPAIRLEGKGMSSVAAICLHSMQPSPFA